LLLDPQQRVRPGADIEFEIDPVLGLLYGKAEGHAGPKYRRPSMAKIMVPHRRRVYPLGADNYKLPEPVLIAVDIARLDFAPA
jgi:hypothetical protein